MIIFYDSLGGAGGSQTLKFRICKWFKEHDISCALMTNDKNDNFTIKMFEDLNIPIFSFKTKNYLDCYEILKKLDDNNLKVICFTRDAYLDIEYVKYKGSMFFYNVLYCIHPVTLESGSKSHKGILNAFITKYYKNILIDIIDNKSLVMMDHITAKSTRKYNDLNDDVVFPIWWLPMYCEKIENYEEIIEKSYKSNKILTAGRAIFPFKGYFMGLIKDFDKLCSEFPDIYLEIVSDGPDIDKIKSFIDSLDESVKKRILLTSWIPYDELNNKILECKLFIGMGTTVIDSSLKYKPSIAVGYNTLENKAKCLFYEDVHYNTVDESCKDDAYSLISKVMNSSYEDYKKMSLLSFSNTEAVYNIEKIIPEILAYKTNDMKSIFNYKNVFIYGLYNRMKSKNNKGN